MYRLFLTLRYLRKRRIAFFAIVGVWLCVAMVVVVISVMGGFLDTVKERSRGLLSDIVIDNATLQGFPFYERFAARLADALPDVVDRATPVIYNYGILRIEHSDFTKPVRIIGIDLPGYCRVNDFCDSLYYDKYYPGTTHLGEQMQPVLGYDNELVPQLPMEFAAAFARYRSQHADDPDLAEWVAKPMAQFPGPGYFASLIDTGPGYVGEPAPGVIVGSSVIYQRDQRGKLLRDVYKGAKIILSILPLTRGGQIGGEGAITVATRLADDSSTRVYEIDSMSCYVDFSLLQKWLDMSPQELEDGGTSPARASQLLVSLRPGVEIQSARQRIEQVWDDFHDSLRGAVSLEDARLLDFVTVETWEERQAPLIAALEKEKILMTILFALISLVTVVLIGCIFWMIVTEKTRDIGIIKSLGGSARGVAEIFVVFGAAVGVVGAAAGVATGSIFVWYINDIQDALVALHPTLRVWSPDVYSFDRIPNMVKAPEIALIGIVAVIASVVGSLIPATLAGRVWPVKALRYE